MKKIIILFVGMTMLAACSGKKDELSSDTIQNGASAGNGAKRLTGEEPVIVFDSKEKKFSKTPEGEIVEIVFNFENKGKSNLLITDVKPGCSCTTPDWPKDPIAPGGKGSIRALFNTEGKGGGMHEKSVAVYSNATEPAISLSFSGEVEAKK
jgi:hypothetical protein